MKYLHLLFIALLFPSVSHAYYPLSPYSYCGGNPVNYTDPTGCVIEGATKKDAAMTVEYFRAMFPGEEFANFRNLIVQCGKKQNGKSLAPISSDALSSAFNGITLNKDQQTLVDMVVNTINSTDIHKVEYVQGTDVLSNQASNAFLPKFMTGALGPHMPSIIEKNGGLPVSLIINQGGGGVTTPIKRGYNNHQFGDHPKDNAQTNN